jgi:hypothetical protein
VFLLGLIGVTMMCANFFALKLTPCSMYSGRKYRWKFGQFTGTLLIFVARSWVFTGTTRVKTRVFTGILNKFDPFHACNCKLNYTKITHF